MQPPRTGRGLAGLEDRSLTRVLLPSATLNYSSQFASVATKRRVDFLSPIRAALTKKRGQRDLKRILKGRIATLWATRRCCPCSVSTQPKRSGNGSLSSIEATIWSDARKL